MSPVIPTVWKIDPHTRAKHQILEEYLKAWFPILSLRSGRILYLDGFAGPGVYEGGEDGSPVIAIKTAANHFLGKQFNEILFYFIEKDNARAQTLRQVLQTRFQVLPKNLKYFVSDAEFAPTLDSVLKNLEKNNARLAPTLAFLDPFGFSGLPMNLIARMLGYNKCEVLITFMAGFVNRFHDEFREDALDELFGTTEWRKVREKRTPEEHENLLIGSYVSQLKKVGAKFVRTFEVRGQYNQLLYYLVFATRALKGLQVMKEAMCKVDRRGTYKFSDFTDADQSFLIDYTEAQTWEPIAAAMIFEKFKGSTTSVEEIEEFVIAESPFIFRKSILRLLESSVPPKITSVSQRARWGTYPYGCAITFSAQ